MSFIGCKVQHETARLLGSIDVPGTKVPLDQMHVTVLYIGEDIPIKKVAKIIVYTYNITSRQTPFNLKTSRVKCFETAAEAGYPIIARVLSPEIHVFHEALKKEFDKANITYSKKFADYRPHVTLAYSPEPIKDIQLAECISWPAHEATLWSGDWGDDRLSTTFPFTLNPVKEGFYRKVKKSSAK